MEFNAQSGIAFVRLLIPLMAFIATALGIEFDMDLVTNSILGVLSVVLFVWAWWKNNNVTFAAQESQKVLNEIKQSQKGE